MSRKKTFCKVAASFLIFCGTMTALPAENIPFVPTVYAAQSSDNAKLIEMYSESIRKNPKDVEAYFMRGLMYSGYQNDKAVEDFSKVIQFEPNKSRGYLQRGIAYRNAAKYDNAVKDFDKVISMEPNNAINYMNRGMAFYLAKNYDKARADYNAVLKINPGQDPALKKAIEDLKKQGISTEGLESPSMGSWAYYGLGLIDYDKKNYQAAIENFNKALNDTENYMFYAARSKCYRKLGNTQNARADWKKFRELKKKEAADLDAFSDSVMKNLELDVDVEDYD